MIFTDKLEYIRNQLEPEMIRIIKLASANQHHQGDLLLWYLNGFYDKNMVDFTDLNGEKMSPYVFGPSLEGHSEVTHYHFINNYRHTHIYKDTLSNYLLLNEPNEKRSVEIANLQHNEELSIQSEMLIYLKFWEADMIIKRLYQLVRLLDGETYDWHLKICNWKKTPDCTGTRSFFTTKILNGIEKHSTFLSDFINKTYIKQIRNSIAHSNYSITARFIGLNNYEEQNPSSQLKVVSFNEWIDIFHNTLELYNQYIALNNLILSSYAQLSTDNGKPIEVLVTKADSSQYIRHLTYDAVWHRWDWT